MYAETPEHSRPRITEVEFVRLRGKRETWAGRHQQPQVKPLDVYAELRPAPYHESKEPKKVIEMAERLYLRIRSDAGVDGLYGALDPNIVPIVLGELREFLLGKDALATEAIWDQLYRLNRHGRSGYYMMAVSAVDNALWDLRGRFFNVPVFRLLGGSTRQEVEAYGSCLGFSVEPELVAERCRKVQEMGFRYQKWFFAYGLSSGSSGRDQNLQLVKILRETLGEGTELMFDAFSGWDLQYALAWAKAAEPYHPYWIEEPFRSDQLENFAFLHRSTSIPVATGEHFYARWEVLRFLQAEALSVVQADPEWCGGTSELMKICALVSAYGIRLIPHNHNIHAALHVVFSQSPALCPLMEFLINSQPSKSYFEKDFPSPQNGRFALPQRAGFGIEFDSAKVEDMSVFSRVNEMPGA
jgi:L-alanine-DL-glutamate epimerase-like enolase superfamily enzyme